MNGKLAKKIRKELVDVKDPTTRRVYRRFKQRYTRTKSPKIRKAMVDALGFLREQSLHTDSSQKEGLSESLEDTHTHHSQKL